MDSKNQMTYEWDDDERAPPRAIPNRIGRYQKADDEHIPINKILKEMYDEDKDVMQCITPSTSSQDLNDNASNMEEVEDDYYQCDPSECYDEGSVDYKSDEEQDPDVLDSIVYKKFYYY